MTQPVSSLPTKFEMTRPLLELMGDDQPWARARLRDAVADVLELTPDQRAETVKSGSTRLEVRVSWALYELKRAGAIVAAGTGQTKITPFGHQLLSKSPGEWTENDLEVSPQYLDDSSTSPDGEVENLPVHWFVGAVFGDQYGDEAYDHTEKFRAEGRWQAGRPHKYAEQILTMKPGDRIAIKAAFTRKHDLPFDINGKTASVMSIKATGTITSNVGDGDSVEVDWDPENLLPEEDWYFWTSRSTVWGLRPNTWKSKALIAFAFEGAEQDYQRFLAEPYWQKKYGIVAKPTLDDDSTKRDEELPDEPTYDVDDIITDGCFISNAELSGYLRAIKRKKNLILQGPPGTGKTWLAKRLAYAIIERKDRKLIHALQFHPTVSYEDFVRGWRPSGDGKLTLTDGVFLDVIDAAVNEPDNNHVLVIEEINRANLAQVLGELLTLLEADKRKPSEALQLAYSRPDEDPVFIPENLFIIGTMNLADRSLAIVDFALRRRFAFADLSPQFNASWQEWVGERNGVDKAVLADLGVRIGALNGQIADDRSLGAQYCIGHSFFTPATATPIDDAPAWIRGVVEQEIRPLLAEYWFDDPDQVDAEAAKLIGTQ